MEDWYELKNDGETRGRIKIAVKFIPKGERDRLGKAVVDAYFPMRKNNRLTLYQDADTPPVKQVNRDVGYFAKF